MSFDEVLRPVHERLDKFQQTGDPDVVLCSAAEDEAAVVWEALPDVDQEQVASAYHALGWLAYWRYNELPAGPDQPELALALTMLAPFADMPEMIPETMRAVLGPGAVPTTQSGLATGLLRYAQAHDDQLVLRAAFELLTAAVDATLAGHPDRWEHLDRLSAAYGLRFDQTGQVDDVERAVLLGEAALAEAPRDEPESAGVAYNLCGIYLGRFNQTRDVADLQRAVELGEQAVASTPPGHRDRLRFLSNLSHAYLKRFNRLGNSDDLRRAIDASAKAVAGTSDDDPHRARALDDLRVAYRARYLADGDPVDLEQAVDLGKRAVAATPNDHPQRTRHLANLGTLYADRYARTGAQSDLTRSIELTAQAVQAAPQHHKDLPSTLLELGDRYLRRFTRSGDRSDLDRAIGIGEMAVDGLPEHHAERAPALMFLAEAYATRSRQKAHPRDRPKTPDLDRAIELTEQALAETPEDHPKRPGRIAALGSRYQTLFAATGKFDCIERAVELHEEALTVALDDNRDLAAILTGLARAYTSWVNMVHLGDIDRGKVRSLAARAARAVAASPASRVHAGLVIGVLALITDDPDTAVEALDRAVALLPLTAPGELERAAQEDRLGDHVNLSAEAISAHLAAGDPPGALVAAEKSRGILLTERLHGFTETEDAPAGPTSGGTVVLVNFGLTRHDAVVLTPGAEPRQVQLPRNALIPHRRAEDLIDATGAAPSLAGTLRRQRVVGDTLRWLWDDLVGPVLTTLPDTPEPHRIWWLPVGYLATLPLHAAGYPGQPGALDLVVSSYLPTLRSLDQARQSPVATTRRQLTIDLSHTPGLPDIPGTAAEAAELHARHPDGLRLSNGNATAAQVLAGLTDCTWAHFACHAHADLATPSQGGLQLHDRTLRLPEIGDLRLQQAELAYLSACSTARVGWRHANEAIHLASAFQLAGFRHVIASLWPLADDVAAAAARMFYRLLPDADAAPSTLRTVTAHLRESYPDRPDLWASLVHSGP